MTADLLIVMGSSLKVGPVNEIPDALDKSVPAILSRFAYHQTLENSLLIQLTASLCVTLLSLTASCSETAMILLLFSPKNWAGLISAAAEMSRK